MDYSEDSSVEKKLSDFQSENTFVQKNTKKNNYL